MRKVAPIALFLFLMACGPASALDGAGVIHRLQERFDKIKTLQADFQKRHYWKLVDQTQEVNGHLVVAKPNRFLLQSNVQTIVTDGVRAWSYDPSNEQVLLTDYTAVDQDQSYEKLLFDLILLGGYDERFSSILDGEERVEGKRCHLLTLTPKEAGAYVDRVRLWVDRKSWLVRKVEYRNINADETTYLLSDLKENKRTKDETFKFQAPDGVEVVDLR